VGVAGLHAFSQDQCPGNSCAFSCDPGEKLVSITCPGGKIAITKTGDNETASCADTPGPALALCMRQ
jgi:hypothetical protein